MFGIEIDGVTLTSAAAQLILLILGVAVSLQEDWSKRNKLIVLAAFFIVGTIAMYSTIKQSSNSAKETAVANAKLSSSLQELSAASNEISRIQRLNTELQKQLVASTAKITELSQQNIYSLTGGDSYCYLRFPTFTPTGGLPIVIHKGKFPLYDVEARIVNLRQFERVAAETPGDLTMRQYMSSSTMLKVGNLAPGSAFSVLDKALPFTDEQPNFRVFFGARNGFWHEDLLLRRIKGQWLHAVRVLREVGNDKKLLFEEIDKGFPRTGDGKVDWPK
jgi:hypothetical protein